MREASVQGPQHEDDDERHTTDCHEEGQALIPLGHVPDEKAGSSNCDRRDNHTHDHAHQRKRHASNEAQQVAWELWQDPPVGNKGPMTVRVLDSAGDLIHTISFPDPDKAKH
jgi:hypothetical protein